MIQSVLVQLKCAEAARQSGFLHNPAALFILFVTIVAGQGFGP